MNELFKKVAPLLKYSPKGPFAIKITGPEGPVLLIADNQILIRMAAPMLAARADGMIPFPKEGTASTITDITAAGFEADGESMEGHATTTEMGAAMGIYRNVLSSPVFCTMELEKIAYPDGTKLEIAGSADKVVTRCGEDKWTVRSGNMSRMFGIEIKSEYFNAFYAQGAKMELKENANHEYCFVHIANAVCEVFFLGKTMLDAKRDLALKTEEKPIAKPKAPVKQKAPAPAPAAAAPAPAAPAPAAATTAKAEVVLPENTGNMGTVAERPAGAVGAADLDEPTTSTPETEQTAAATRAAPEILSPEDIFARLTNIAEQAKKHEEIAVADRRAIQELVKTIRRSLNTHLRGGANPGELDALKAEITRLKGELNKYVELKKALGKLQ